MLTTNQLNQINLFRQHLKLVQVLVQAYSGLEHRALWLHGYKQEIYKEAKQMLTEMVGNDMLMRL